MENGRERSARQPSEAGTNSPRLRHGIVFRLASVAVVVVTLTTASGFLMFNWLHAPQPPGGAPDGASQAPASASAPGTSPSARLFRTWPRDRKPELVLVLSGEVHGYMQPCGCSEPQYGGLERRYNFAQSLVKERGWPVVPVDVGDVAQNGGPQAKIKYRYIMDGMRLIGYSAVGIGLNEMAMPLIDALAEYALNNVSPRVLSANLLNKQVNFPGPNGSMVASWDLAQPPGAPRVGVMGVVARTIAGQVRDPNVNFGDAAKSIETELTLLQEKKPDLLVLLFQGTSKEAMACAKQFPQFHVVLCLTREEEPPGAPERVGNTMVIGVGHKGRYVGAVGVFRGQPNQGFDLHYELVSLGPEWKTPAGHDADNPLLALYEDYAREVKNRNYLAQYPKTPHPIQQNPKYAAATYVGSEKCKKCHEESYKVWKDSPHSHAYASLEKATRPSLRQYDGECVVCHVVGFQYNAGFADEKQTPKLIDNGCENCHGPGSLHIKNEHDEELHALMNPYKTPAKETPEQKNQRENRLNDSCIKCHDIDNDVTWKLEKWKKIEHHEPKQ
jgi:hypothetical protein